MGYSNRPEQIVVSSVWEKGGTSYVSSQSFIVLRGHRRGLQHPGDFRVLVALCEELQLQAGLVSHCTKRYTAVPGEAAGVCGDGGTLPEVLSYEGCWVKANLFLKIPSHRLLRSH